MLVLYPVLAPHYQRRLQRTLIYTGSFEHPAGAALSTALYPSESARKASVGPPHVPAGLKGERPCAPRLSVTLRLGGFLDCRIVLLRHLLVTVDLLCEAPALAPSRHSAASFFLLGPVATAGNAEGSMMNARCESNGRPGTTGDYVRAAAKRQEHLRRSYAGGRLSCQFFGTKLVESVS